MATVSLYLAVTFVMALVAILLRLPPLVGFLAAGFVLQAIGAEVLPGLDTFAGLGVTLLLFGIGLKLDVRGLLHREVWLTSLSHMVVMTVLGAGFLAVLALTGSGLVTRDGGDGLLLWVSRSPSPARSSR